MAERAQYVFEAEQPTPDSYHVRVADPTGRRWAQWWVFPVPPLPPSGGRLARRRYRAGIPTGARFVLCSRPDPAAVIRAYPEFDKATAAANLRARTWLGSCWGLKSPARKLP